MSIAPRPTFTPENTTQAYQLRHHFAWYARNRDPLFHDRRVRRTFEVELPRAAQQNEIHLVDWEIQPHAIRALASLSPAQSPSGVSRAIKGNLATQARRQTGMTSLWSRGWFVRSTGTVSGDTVREYVEQQAAHHRVIPPQSPDYMMPAHYRNPAAMDALRTSSHVAFEYNLHLVIAVGRRVKFLDPRVAAELIGYTQRVCCKKRWILWNMEAVWDHVHLVLGLSPSESAESVALSYMNNTCRFLEQRYAASIGQAEIESVWQSGYYAGTIGAASTAQITSYLRDLGA